MKLNTETEWYGVKGNWYIVVDKDNIEKLEYIKNDDERTKKQQELQNNFYKTI